MDKDHSGMPFHTNLYNGLNPEMEELSELITGNIFFEIARIWQREVVPLVEWTLIH